MDFDTLALDIINTWEAREYLHPAQKKAALQVAIRNALDTERTSLQARVAELERERDEAREYGQDMTARWKKQIHEIGPALVARATTDEASVKELVEFAEVTLLVRDQFEGDLDGALAEIEHRASALIAKHKDTSNG